MNNTPNTFKVTTHEGNLVNAGTPPKGSEAFSGIDEATATSDAADRNRRAEKLGINTRYVVAPL